jgi:hypothetical protein
MRGANATPAKVDAKKFFAIRPATPADNVVPMVSEPTEAVALKRKTRKKIR